MWGKRVPLKTKRNVKFASKVKSFRRTISKKDSKCLWYKQDDYTSFEQGIRDTLRALSEVKGDLSKLNPAKYCVQGLEQQLTRRQAVRRRMHTMQRTQAILHQQNYQRYYGINDPDALKSVSRLFSQQETKRAHMRAVLNHSLADESLKQPYRGINEGWYEGRDEQETTRHCPVA